MTNISMSIVTMLYNWQLMRLMGADGVAVYGVIMYVNFIFVAIFLGYSMGSAPIVGYHYGAGNQDELRGLLRKSLQLIALMSVVLTAAALRWQGRCSLIFVSMTRRAGRAPSGHFPSIPSPSCCAATIFTPPPSSPP